MTHIDKKQAFYATGLLDFLSLVAVLSQLNDHPFDMPLSLPQYSLFTIIHPAILNSCLPYRG
jgi:hypothetical protein